MTKTLFCSLGLLAALAICGCTQQAPAPSNPNVTTGQAPSSSPEAAVAAEPGDAGGPKTTLVRLVVPGMT